MQARGGIYFKLQQIDRIYNSSGTYLEVDILPETFKANEDTKYVILLNVYRDYFTVLTQRLS